MIEKAYRLVKSFERRVRRKIKRVDRNALPRDFPADFRPIVDTCRPFTMTGALRMFALYEAVKHIERAGIAGDIVECGVWRGGSAMVAAMTLLALGKTDRTIWLYDTFEGMTQPSDRDVDLDGRKARMRWNTEWAVTSKKHEGVGSDWCYASLEEVRDNVLSTGYPKDRVRFVRGRVEDTIPTGGVPDRIALLRLDTDWYESTLHEFTHLYPKLERGGVLILDDYGSWQGARQATDEYFKSVGSRPFLARIDEAARIGIKQI